MENLLLAPPAQRLLAREARDFLRAAVPKRDFAMAVNQMDPLFRAVQNRLADLRRDFAGQFPIPFT
jgi:hypothetical protein